MLDVYAEACKIVGQFAARTSSLRVNRHTIEYVGKISGLQFIHGYQVCEPEDSAIIKIKDDVLSDTIPIQARGLLARRALGAGYHKEIRLRAELRNDSFVATELIEL